MGGSFMYRSFPLLALGLSVFAAPIRFDFTFQDPTSAANAVGYIVFEDTLLPNPGFVIITLPDPAISDLSVTVSGATAGNGTFGLADFSSVVFDTNGGTLDFGFDLVGQATSGSPWGTPDMNGGDFNLFAAPIEGARYSNIGAGDGIATPSGVWYFTLGANNGQNEEMLLVSMRSGRAVPALGIWATGVFVALLCGAAIVMHRRRGSVS